MEKYFPIVIKTGPSGKRKGEEASTNLRGDIVLDCTNVHADQDASNNQHDRSGAIIEYKLSSSEEIGGYPRDDPSPLTVTQALLKNLCHISNPITHSDIGKRSDHVVSFATGHQVSESRANHSEYLVDRNRKLRTQREDSNRNSGTGVLRDVIVYIDGYLEATTDIEMKRIVSQAGGQIIHTAAQCTHIVTSRPLSGSKTERFLARKTKKNIYVVKPEWVFDSISIGKRRPERSYAVLKASNTLQKFLGQ